MKNTTSEELKADIHVIKQAALQVRAEISSEALIWPQQRIKRVVDARAKWGPNVVSIPGDT